MTRVAVMRHPHKADWERVLEVFEPNWLQTDAEDLRWIKLPPSTLALPVYRDSDAPADSDLPDRLLFEGTQSGSGRVADWDEASGELRSSYKGGNGNCGSAGRWVWSAGEFKLIELRARETCDQSTEEWPVVAGGPGPDWVADRSRAR